ncbi:hypothetical protein NQ315_016249 [Exocentrus adspersus]|uniref:DDE Tnp4 domain-containing protein n=1 Tax=Exocentrus adspersus TaxID=1586481 RepID=A0AAV8VJ87_9CUCU|nr:hypothetical protein NQ315_016249 [Exocentrus adspersus]
MCTVSASSFICKYGKYEGHNTKLKILNVCARFPGSSHDSFIWNNSNAHTFMVNLHEREHRSFFLLGDSGYPLRSYLLTPCNDAVPDSPEDRYNIAQRRIRSIIERCNGVLKLRFRCLLKHRMLHYSPEKSSKIINATTVLHNNLCIDANLPNVVEEPGDLDLDFGIYEADINLHMLQGRNPLNEGRRQRNYIIRTRFQ